ncbi:TPA: flagellar hook basal-body protein [Vibrio vulnificus]|nr:flagellar hook basal-body protein [Vibrio vulnificus]
MEKIPALISQTIRNDIADVNRISENAKHVNSVGFKSILTRDVDKNKLVNIGELLDMSSGELKATGRSLDLAIGGEAWFLVKSSKGLYLTRDGQFFVHQGKIVNQDGSVLQGEAGDISLSSPAIDIDRKGNLLSEEKQLDRILLIKLEKVKRKHIQSGMIKVEDMTALSVSNSSQVLQGYLESSNVDPSRAVTSLMSEKRHIETMQRTLSTYEHVMQKVISDLGK